MRNGQIVCRCGHEKAYHFAGPCCIKTIGGLGLVESNCKCREYRPCRVGTGYVLLAKRDGKYVVIDGKPAPQQGLFKWHRVEVLVPVTKEKR